MNGIPKIYHKRGEIKNIKNGLGKSFHLKIGNGKNFWKSNTKIVDDQEDQPC